jgi:hypothetical protein
VRWVISQGHAAARYYRLGYARALAAAGHEVFSWDADREPAGDLFTKQFDWLLAGTWELTPALVRQIVRTGVKVFLWGTNNGPWTCDKEDTVEFADARQKELARRLADAGAARHVFHYYHPHYIEETMSGWREEGLEPVGLPLAADVFAFPLTKPDPNLASSVAFVGGRWPYKSKELDAYLLPLCHPSEGLSVKIYGNGHWPVPQHLGLIDDATAPKVLASATVCPCIYEPLSVKYHMDVSERPYKALSVGGFAVSQYVRSAAEDLFPDGEMVFVTSPAEFKEVVHHFVRNPAEREPFIRQGLETVYSRHCYFDRLASAFQTMGLEGAEVGRVVETKKAVVMGLARRAAEWSPEKARVLEKAVAE